MIRILTMLAALAAGLTAADPVKVLILTGNSDMQYHSWPKLTAAIQSLLGGTGRFDVRTIEEPRAITADALKGYAAVLLNYNGPRFAPAAEKAIEEYIRGGGGFIAFHHASYGEFFGMRWVDGKWRDGAASEAWAEYPKIIGASWEAAKIGHARRWTFTVDWKDRAHPVAAGLGPGFTANDELYHRLNLSPTAHVLADALSPTGIGGTGRREPLIWTNNYGRGRVFYTVLGHDTMAFYQPGMMNAFARGVEWAATGGVTIPVIDPHRAAKANIRLLVVTGGHSYPTEFYAMLDSLPGVRWTHATSPAEAFARPLEERYDAILLHDMGESAAEQTRARLKAFVEAGKGIVSMHHSIVDYTDWPWWYQEVTGGKYFVNAVEGHAASRYREGAEFLVEPSKGKEKHPVLAGVGPLWVHDELYQGMWISPKVEVLMETGHPENDRPVVYAGPHPKARVVYIQLGHSAHTMGNPGFRRLVSNAVAWAGRRAD
jgi:type 1 glutamine amidotransferase